MAVLAHFFFGCTAGGTRRAPVWDPWVADGSPSLSEMASLVELDQQSSHKL